MDIQYSDTNNSGSEINLQNDYVKLRYIREVNSKLGIVHSNIEGVVISRKTVEKIDAYLLKEESTISDVFNLKIIKNDQKNRTLKKNIEFLNKIYGSWKKIASNSKDHKIVNEFITQSPYLANLPPPYEITYNKEKKSKCLININNAVAVKESQIIVAEVLDIIIMDIINEAVMIPNKYKRCREDTIDGVVECKCGISINHICNCENPNYVCMRINNKMQCSCCKKWKCRCN
jgi:hypothetical protein